MMAFISADISRHSIKYVLLLISVMKCNLTLLCYLIITCDENTPSSRSRYFGFETRLDGHQNCQDRE